MPKNQNASLSPSQLLNRRKKTIAITAVILAVVILPPALLAALFHPGAPNALCKTCHEMRAPYASWAVSLHNDTPCDECHKAPSVAAMALAKIRRGGEKTHKALEPHLSEGNCLSCHEGKIKQGTIVVNGIKLNHGTHFNKDISCLVCHKGTGHKPDTAVSLMAGENRSLCLNCHNDLHGKGSSECSVCHAPQGMKLGSVTGEQLKKAGISQPHHRNAKEAGQDCSKCHSREYCWGCHVTQNPHPAEGFDHVKESKENGKYCTQCHTFDFCTDCHVIKKEHNAKTFKQDHGKFADKVATCEGLNCHTAEFCNDCHGKRGQAFKMEGAGRAMHPEEFVKTHPLFASNTALSNKCLECHDTGFCISCHQGKTAHPAEWAMGHAAHLRDIAAGKVKRTESDECTACHTTAFCASCHKKSSAVVAPSHPANFKDTHKKDPQSKTGLCKNCHSAGSCSGPGCHQAVTLPHTPEFNAGQHKNASMAQTAECAKCHGPDLCMDCHKTNAPATHKAKDWYKAHKQPAQISKPFCNLCHDNKQFCGACHKSQTSITHRGDWAEKGHVNTKKSTELAQCASCHRMDTCSQTCHSPAEISKRNPGKENHKSCYKCHVSFDWKRDGSKACAQCHMEPAKQSLGTRHTVCTVCHDTHQNTVAGCASKDCHQDIKAKLPAEHAKEPDCGGCHKPHDWNSKALFSNCTNAKCHADIQKKGLHKIKAHTRCGECHDAHTAKAKTRATTCVKCHEKGTPLDLEGAKGLCAKPELDCDAWK
jgi:hypothetical protein